DLQKIVQQVHSRIIKDELRTTKTCFLKIAIMGCEVNGPLEARHSDIGIACGKGSGVIFKKGKIIKKVKEKDIVKELLNETRRKMHYRG
ncbi:MAG: flavodoxin-dependent (E)-4-hydroxy-3-methylbut-2-enyl-diphosphate synthase, partial [Candidatus Omnitrophota bacterium]